MASGTELYFSSWHRSGRISIPIQSVNASSAQLHTSVHGTCQRVTSVHVNVSSTRDHEMGTTLLLLKRENSKNVTQSTPGVFFMM